MQPLCVSRRGSSVILELPEDLLAALRPHLALHYTVSAVGAVPDGVWVLSLGSSQRRQLGTFLECETRVRREPPRKVIYDLQRRIILLETSSSQWLSIFLCRMVRDVLRWELLERGVLFLHGGMVALNGIGIALIGPPRSGKTSTALALLGAAGACHVAENDLAVEFSGNMAVGMGWPRSVCIRGDTLGALDGIIPGLRQCLTTAVHPYNGKLSADGVRLFHILPSEIAQLTKRSVLDHAKLGMLVFPKFVMEGDGSPQLERLSEAEAAWCLMDNWDFIPERKLGARANQALDGNRRWDSMCFNPFLGSAFDIPRVETLKPTILRLARVLPSYALRQTLEHLRFSSGLLASETTRLAVL